ncbi:amidase family protein [Allosalinactinospora lopnorensis]|uniref:amidase family protein n=1 Tax=Allosalinactinospora lopnorensis TaxID=1352348 RepID=UPI00069907A8|nr:amidase family protein [Allosalinactinospora lopnorensis]
MTWTHPGTDKSADSLGALVPETPVIAATPDGTSGAAPLDGLTFVVKDVLDVAGTVTGAGNPDWAASHDPARRHARAVAMLLRAGARCVGKGRCAELAYSLSGDNAHYGMPRNPAAPAHDPGGSTSGPASAVAADLCDLGLGTDTLGSIRVPASYCGLYGYRPTHGAIPTTGALPLAQRFDTVGLLSRDLHVLRGAAGVLLGADAAGAEPPRRLLLATEALDVCDPRVAEVVRETTVRIGLALDVPWEEVELLRHGGPNLSSALDAFSVLQGTQVWNNFSRWIENIRPALGPDVEARVHRAARISREEIERAEPVADAVAATVRRLGRNEVLVIAAAGTVTPARDAGPGPRQEARVAAGRLTCLASLAGAPALSLPLGRVEGLPVGVCLVARPGNDRLLLGPVSGPFEWE